MVFTTLPETPEFGWDLNLVLAHLRKIPGSAGKNIDFCFNYTPKCMVSSMNFQKFSGEELPPMLNLRLHSRFGLPPQFSNASRPRYGFHPQFTPPTCLLTPPPTEGTRLKTLFSTNPNSWSCRSRLFIFPWQAADRILCSNRQRRQKTHPCGSK